MSGVSTLAKRLFLRVIYQDASEGDDSLYNLLMAAAKARLADNGSGRVLISTAANGHQHSWQIPNDFSPRDATELISELLDRYDEAKAKLIADGTASPTDAQIYAEMLVKLQPVRSIQHDFYNLRTEREEVTT